MVGEMQALYRICGLPKQFHYNTRYGIIQDMESVNQKIVLIVVAILFSGVGFYLILNSIAIFLTLK